MGGGGPEYTNAMSVPCVDYICRHPLKCLYLFEAVPFPCPYRVGISLTGGGCIVNFVLY
jgi:hypothetical protein